jgi:transcriptional regulator with XRE-family HTH domain
VFILTKNTIGDNIKRLRKNKSLTQNDLAIKSGLTRESIGNYERGDRQPNIEMLTKISDALEVPVSTLIGNEEITKLKFEEDFDIDKFDIWIMKIINEHKDAIELIYDAKLTSVEVVQYIVIDSLANNFARIDAGFEECGVSYENILENKSITSEELFKSHYDNYLACYKKEWKELFESKLLVYKRLAEINQLKKDDVKAIIKYYTSYPEEKRPIEFDYILEFK